MEQRQLESIIRTIAMDIPETPTDKYIKRLTELIAQTGRVEYAFIARNVDKIVESTQSFGFYCQHEFIEPIKYNIKDTPCNIVINENRMVHHPVKVQELFPYDEDFKTLKIQGYIGTPIPHPSGKAMGHIVLMSGKVLHLTELQKELLKLYALKVSVILQRYESQMSEENLQA